jgi:molybdopterin biosynthesis enzyme
MLLWRKIGKCWYEEIYESDTRFPQQFIYSTGDELINYEDVDHLVARRKKMNKVFVQKFGSQSPHVAHLRHDEEKYTETINRFFKLAIGRDPILT